ncbi:hypothetical protein BU100_09985 [Staphylococcus xylosus]|nr:hypothetical protein AWC37_10225 [Staphylococcus xylosus]KTW23159.1 hypothetical protein NS341_05275 [Staphylococcus xylosus]PHS81099.1 hypothetical protein BTM19_05980 [Staphylococcus xylosus]PNZ16069.1 hypothetical protein CD106_03780 [Staphylococcus xylosus]RIM93168.1 hypothetical protein BU100_09985 [Staphylococcus xylosus]
MSQPHLFFIPVQNDYMINPRVEFNFYQSKAHYFALEMTSFNVLEVEMLFSFVGNPPISQVPI